ncbi:MAG TPA: MarR family transcriptional regulator [Pseudonocardiaceae bacterium]|jgi:DNA-binding MarR family transcriptional regulator|nr:MarR family transcriptional regulator [Pseudonocardiaceae bacterium]
MSVSPLDKGLGTQLRHVLEEMDGAVAEACADLGLSDYRPRFSPIVRALVELGPSSIRDLALAISVTHSAASQTVAQLARRGLVTLAAGSDARQRIVRLTDQARASLPVIQAEWTVTRAAAVALDAELPFPLSDLVAALVDALARRPFRERIADAARAVDDPAIDPFRAALTRAEGERG